MLSTVKVQSHFYELLPAFLRVASPRQGALLRVESSAGVGYADLHPWPELGDLPLGSQLERLRKGQLTALTRNSLRLAEIDARARARGVSVFEDLTIPASHLLLARINPGDDSDSPTLLNQKVEELVAQVHAGEFSRIKLKVGTDLRLETAFVAGLMQELDARVKLRLDFNAKIGSADVEEWFSRLRASIGDYSDRFDFVEDPVKWNPVGWRELKSRLGIRLAGDREIQELAFATYDGIADFGVIKPAVFDFSTFDFSTVSRLRWVVTSYLDHPLGQMGAAYFAADLDRKLKQRGLGPLEVCGLLSQSAYLPTAFSEALQVQGAFLHPAEGTGMGFDSLLANLKWVDL